MPSLATPRPRDRGNADDTVIAQRDDAGAAAAVSVVSQVLAGGGLTVTNPLGKKLNRALGIAIIHWLDNHIRNAHALSLAQHRCTHLPPTACAVVLSVRR
jgi:hypothetical protein